MGDTAPATELVPSSATETVDDATLLQQAHDEFERLNPNGGEDDEDDWQPWPAYFFPSLSTQRTVFCLDLLKRQDIKSVSLSALTNSRGIY